MRKTAPIFLALCAAAQMLGLGSAPAMAAPANDPNAVVITVGQHKITAGQLDAIIKTLPQQYQETARGPGKREFATNLAEIEILADQAAKTGLDKRPDVQAQLEFQHTNLLAQAMFRNMAESSKVSDAQVQAYYDAHKADYETVTARHILIRVKGAPMPVNPGKKELSDADALAKAKSIRKRLVGGEDFAKLAKAESDDTGSGANGGELGSFKKGVMVPPFEAVAFALKPGDISEPVKTVFGYHIIQVQTHSMKTLDEAKPDIVAQLKPAAVRQTVAAMVGSTKVDLSEAFFGPAPKPGAGGPAPASK